MKNEKVKVEFSLPDEKKRSFELKHLNANIQIVDCRQLVALNREGWLIKIKHRFQQTHFILSGVTPYALIGFKANGTYQGVTFSTNETDAPFAAELSYPLLVLIPFDSFLDIIGLQSVQIK